MEPGIQVKFGDHDLNVLRETAGKGYWVVIGPRVLRGGRVDARTGTAYYGTIHDDGKIHAWGGRGEAGRHYKYALEGVLRELVRRGKARDMAGEARTAKARAEESKTGSFIVKVSTGQKSRFHDFPRANRWAEDVIKSEPPGTRAEFFRDPGESPNVRALTGIPWTEPFHVVEKNEHGHIVMGSGRPKAASHGDYQHAAARPWIVYRRIFAVPSIVGRYKDSTRAHEVARENRAFCKHITSIDRSLKKALGLRN